MIINPFITKVKHLRILTIVLGRLGLSSLRKERSDYSRRWTTNPNMDPRFDDKYLYGWTLKESKDFVEKLYAK